MSRGNHYGKLGVANLPSEVKTIWYSRDVEPDPCEPIDIWWPVATDPEQELEQDFARRLIAVTPLTELEEQAIVLCVLGNCTLHDAGEEIGGRSKERVRQILNKAMRKFRKHQKTLTELNAWELDARVVPWYWWKYEERKKRELRRS